MNMQMRTKFAFLSFDIYFHAGNFFGIGFHLRLDKALRQSPAPRQRTPPQPVRPLKKGLKQSRIPGRLHAGFSPFRVFIIRELLGDACIIRTRGAEPGMGRVAAGGRWGLEGSFA